MQICGFLWVYYGYPASSYEGINVEAVRYRCGAILARRDDASVDLVAGIPDSGTGHGLGYAAESCAVGASLKITLVAPDQAGEDDIAADVPDTPSDRPPGPDYAAAVGDAVGASVVAPDGTVYPLDYVHGEECPTPRHIGGNE